MNPLNSSGEGVPDYSELEEILSSLIDLLGRFAKSDSVEWLESRRQHIKSEDRATRRKAVAELHKIVLGMGGLTDIYLRDPSPTVTQEANAQLDILADRLYRATGPNVANSQPT